MSLHSLMVSSMSRRQEHQTLKIYTLGVWLDEPTFTHGQLYVAASDPQNIHFAVNNGVSRKTMNVACKKIL